MAKLLDLKRGLEGWVITPEHFHLIRYPDVDENGKKLNKRIDFSDIPAFTMQIILHGKIEIPVTGYIKDGLINITDGERRCRSSIAAFEGYQNEDKTPVRINIPFIKEKNGTTVVDRLFKQIRLNNQRKDFTPVEEAEVISELINQGVEEQSIIAELNYSKVYLSNLKLLQKAPDSLKKFIGKRIITSTLAMDIIRETKGDYDKALKMIE
ncbi:MAG: hypothetical protein AABY22_05755, partial [Nanoarchaeota archaeon]